MDQAMQFAEAAVREFLLFRGFTNTLEAFHSDLYSDVGSGFQVGRILDLIFRVHVPSFEAEKLVNLLAFLNSLVAASADVWLQETAKQLECNLKRYYIVHALQRGRADRVLEFFQQHAEGLLRSGDRDWFVWFAIPYVTNPGSDPNFKEYFSSEWSDALELSFRKFLLKIFEGIRLPALLKFGFEESKCVALEKELEQMREVINTKDDEIAYLRRDSPRHGSDPRVKKVVPDYRVSPPVTHIKSPLSSGGSIEERENEGDNEAAAKDEFNPSSTSGDFSESGKSSERTNSSKWRPLLRRNSSIRSTYSGGSQLEKTDFVSDATNSREKEGEVSQVAIQYQEAFSGHTSPITKCRYSATGAKIAIASVNGTVRILSSDVAVASSQNATISAGAEVLALEWEHLSDRMLLFGTAERNIKAWNVEAKRVVCDLTTEAMFPRVLDLRCSPTDSVFCCAAASETTTPGEGVHGLGYGSLTIWNMRTWKAMTSLQLGHEPPVMTSVCFNDNGKILAAGATDGKIRIFDLRENLPKIGWPAHAGCAVSCVRFGHDQNSVFSLGADGKIFEWSLHNQGQVLHKANASSYCALPSGTLPRHEFAIGSGGRYVLLTSNTTTAPLYKWGSPLTHKNLEHTSGNILSVDQSPESDRTVGSVGPIVIVRSGNQVKGLEGTELLDVVLTYLWRVHSVDYYGMTEYKEQPKRLRHIRAPEAKSGGDPKNNAEEAGFVEWEKKLDSTWQARLQSGDIIISMLGREKLDTTANEALDPFVRKIRDEKYGWKYGCGAKGCTKLFHGPEFVHKHLKLKHSDLVADVVAKAREELYFQNYMSDPDAPGANQAVASQPGQRDGDRGRRGGRFSGPGGGPGNRGGSDWPPADHPPRDGRFGPRNGERFEQGSGPREEEQRFERGGRDEKARFDRGGPEHTPPPRDYPLGAGGPPFEGGGPAQGGPFEGGPMEPPMFDHFNGPPLRGLPGGLFVPDMPGPPQVLMPVPGAGPLGPFVPAPPEMAMRFLREGPGPFRPGGFDGGYQDEGNGGPRGGKRGAPGPMMGGGLLDVPPMMMPPHGMRRDPRGVRSYHDLDAPEDEVSVIDYRSL